MLRIVAAGLTALFVTASPLAYAQTAASAATTPSAAEWNSLTDMRIDVVKAALKLTPDQEKYWPAVEDAIRARAKNRQARFAEIEKRVVELREGILSRFCATVIRSIFCNDVPMHWLNGQRT